MTESNLFYRHDSPQIPGWFFIGDNIEQITEGLVELNKNRPYDLVRIPLDEIREVQGVEIPFCLPCSTNEYLDVEIVPGFIFSINPSAFDYARKIKDYSTRFGELYGFQPNPKNIFFIPERIIEAASKFDWAPHISRMDQAIAKRESALDSLAQKGVLRRD